MAVVKRALRAGDQETHAGGVRKGPKVPVLRHIYSEQTVGRLSSLREKINTFIRTYPGHQAEMTQLASTLGHLQSYLYEEVADARADDFHRIEVEKRADFQLTNLEKAFKRITGK
ncbi:hypothetical protein IIC68_03750 [archaeon]|nr:hypothetical protein [archaeon]